MFTATVVRVVVLDASSGLRARDAQWQKLRCVSGMANPGDAGSNPGSARGTQVLGICVGCFIRPAQAGHRDRHRNPEAPPRGRACRDDDAQNSNAGLRARDAQR